MASEIEQKVMASVGAIYLGRKFTSMTAIKLYVLCVSLIAITSLVSVPDVVSNLMQVSVGDVGTFLVAAILNTKLLVQIGLLIGCAVFISLITEIFRRDTASRGLAA